MSDFLAAALAYPTVVYTVMLGVFLIYTLATLLGATDIEWLDHALGIDHVQDSVLEGALSFLGVANIPLTIFAGVASIFAWLSSFAADKFLPDSMLLDTGILVGAGLFGLGASALAVRPFRGFFSVVEGPYKAEHVGKICEVRSLRVDDHTGTADIGGTIAEIRCFRENTLTIGSKAIVYDYEPKEGLYHVGPIDASIVEVDAVLAQTPRVRDLAN
jgi:hypothetical protein